MSLGRKKAEKRNERSGEPLKRGPCRNGKKGKEKSTTTREGEKRKDLGVYFETSGGRVKGSGTGLNKLPSCGGGELSKEKRIRSRAKYEGVYGESRNGEK